MQTDGEAHTHSTHTTAATSTAVAAAAALHMAGTCYSRVLQIGGTPTGRTVRGSVMGSCSDGKGVRGSTHAHTQKVVCA
eukprot:29033-Eustigmatos_ZCMA.PRE.1